jgi:predicted alpha/beta superfamily hydrolase
MTAEIQAKIDQYELPHPSGEGVFQISVARVADAATRKRDVPILFVLDADMAFALAAEIARLRGTGGLLPTAMVVGVGYGADFAQMTKLRTADLTPPLSEVGRQALGRLADMIGEKEGGAEAFLTFLTDTLAPDILARYPEASPSNHILFGHSLAGLFAAYALLTRPHVFAAFLASSPALWWDGFAVLSHLAALPAKLRVLDRQPLAFICVGGKEQDPPTKTSPMVPMSLPEMQAVVAQARMVDAAAELAPALRQAGLRDVTYVAFQDEDHGTVIPSAITRGLALAVPQPE